MNVPLLGFSDGADGRRTAIRFPDRSLDFAGLSRASGWVADRIAGASRVAVWAQPRLETCVAVVGALVCGVEVVPINPKSGQRELSHILADSCPEALLIGPGADVPASPGCPASLLIDLDQADQGTPWSAPPPPPDHPALVVYTSGTTGAPKGAVLPRHAIASNLDALAEAWRWRSADVVAQALPLFHVHGLVLGVLGPLRRGGTARHLVRFSPEAVVGALEDDATMLFAVPTMYRRLADAAERDPAVGRALSRARLLVSGSAALPAADHERIQALSGTRVVERYGMTETLMNTAVRADGDRRAGYVGSPLPGVGVRLVDDDGVPIDVSDDESIGEIEVQGPNLFIGYLNRPDATAAVWRSGWFRTGDLATRAGDGYIRIVGRRATDLIKSGGFKIGAGEIEAALREHPAVDDAAVTGEPDSDLGERVVAWVVVRADAAVTADELAGYVGSLLAPHKRPRIVHFIDDLPRNELGKVQKQRLAAPGRRPPRA